jgi:hypothetical protein
LGGEGDVLALDAVDDDGDWGLRDRLHAGYLWGVKALCAQIVFWKVSLSALLYKGCVLPCDGGKP